MPTNYMVVRGNRYKSDTVVEHHQTENGANTACQTAVSILVQEMFPTPDGFIHYWTDESNFDFFGVVAIDVVTP